MKKTRSKRITFTGIDDDPTYQPAFDALEQAYRDMRDMGMLVMEEFENDVLVRQLINGEEYVVGLAA